MNQQTHLNVLALLLCAGLCSAQSVGTGLNPIDENEPVDNGGHSNATPTRLFEGLGDLSDRTRTVRGLPQHFVRQHGRRSPEMVLEDRLEAMVRDALSSSMSSWTFSRVHDALQDRIEQNERLGRSSADLHLIEDAVHDLEARTRDFVYDVYESRMLLLESVDNRLDRALDAFEREALFLGPSPNDFRRVRRILNVRYRAAASLGGDQMGVHLSLEAAVEDLLTVVELHPELVNLSLFEGLIVDMLELRLGQAVQWLQRQAMFGGPDASHLARVAVYQQQLDDAQAGSPPLEFEH